MNRLEFFRRWRERAPQGWPRVSLRTYLAAMVLVAVLPIAGVTTWRVASDIAAEQTQVEATLARSAGSFAQSVERELGSSIDALTVLSRSELFQQERIRTLGQLLHGRPRRDWDSMFVLDRDGSLLLDTGVQRSGAPEQPRLRELHRQVVAGLRPIVTSLAADDGPGPRNMAIAMPVMQNGQLRYVLGARLADGIWQRLATSSDAPEGARTALLDDRQRLLGFSGLAPQPATREYTASQRIASTGWEARVALPAAGVDASRRATVMAALSTNGLSLLVGVLLAAALAVHVVRSQSKANAKTAELRKLSHDLRNTLSAISVAVQVLEALPGDSPSAADAREIIARHTRTLSHQLNELLAAK